MQEAREARSIIEAAEQAATEGNYASAEELLREAAFLQEASHGPLHPDLANTLNNLGVVCEIILLSPRAETIFVSSVKTGSAGIIFGGLVARIAVASGPARLAAVPVEDDTRRTRRWIDRPCCYAAR